MRIFFTISMLIVGSIIYSQNPKGIVSDYTKLTSKDLSDNGGTAENPYAKQNMTTNNSRANANGELSMFQMKSKEKNKLNRLSNSIPKITNDDILNEIKRREIVAENFQKINTKRVKQIDSLYNQIPLQNFTRNINGSFRAHLFIKKKYSFSNNQKLVTEVPCLIEVEKNKIIQIYPYGKKGFALDYPKKLPSNSSLSEGIVQYYNPKTEETLTVVLLDPFLLDEPKQYKMNDAGVGFVTLYTSKKNDHGKLVWIQEIDVKGNINREISQSLVYAKNEMEAIKMNIKPMAINTEHDLYYFGEPTKTTYGVLPLFLKTSQSDMKPIRDNEMRLVRIMIYRD